MAMHRRRNARLLSGLSAGGLAFAAFAGPAGAAPQISLGTYIDTASRNCTSNYFCSIAFSAIPAGKTVTIQNISCRLVHPATGTFYYLFFGGNLRTTHLNPGTPIVIATTGGNTDQYNFTSEVFAPYVAGQTPTVTFANTVNATVSLPISVSCTIAGDIVP